ncbi:MAG: aminopeptidase [Actinobacteria bacterium]|nr:aminopeptidase [Actinomycetota bacterium]
MATAASQPEDRPGELVSREELERYAEAVLHGCLGLRADDALIVQARPEHRDLVGALAESAYRGGARLVEVVYAEAGVRAARLRHAREEHLGTVAPWQLARARAELEPDTCSLTVLGEDERELDGVDPERVATDFRRTAQALRPFARASRQGKRRWTGLAWPTPEWASRVYPELEPLEAERLLARDLLHFCRLGPSDPPGHEGWKRHTARLLERGRRLTELDLRRLELRAPGTALDLRVPAGARWLGGPRRTAHGSVVAGNFPTEENFTSPEAASTEGTFRCSRPLSFGGRVIEGIRGEFRRGKLVRLEADREDDRRLLAATLDLDAGARRLGEVALVDRSSRIGQTGRTYFTTLLDENAAAHIAFGFGFDQARTPDEARGSRGVNRSALHLDVMVGTDDLEATGVTQDGRRVPLIRGGEWQVAHG